MLIYNAPSSCTFPSLDGFLAHRRSSPWLIYIMALMIHPLLDFSRSWSQACSHSPSTAARMGSTCRSRTPLRHRSLDGPDPAPTRCNGDGRRPIGHNTGAPRVRSFIRGTTVVCVVALVMGSSMVLIEWGITMAHAQTPGDPALGRFLTELPRVASSRRNTGTGGTNRSTCGPRGDEGLISASSMWRPRYRMKSSMVRRDDASSTTLASLLSSPIGTLGGPRPVAMVVDPRGSRWFSPAGAAMCRSIHGLHVHPPTSKHENAIDAIGDLILAGARFVHLEDRDDHREHQIPVHRFSATIPTAFDWSRSD